MKYWTKYSKTGSKNRVLSNDSIYPINMECRHHIRSSFGSFPLIRLCSFCSGLTLFLFSYIIHSSRNIVGNLSSFHYFYRKRRGEKKLFDCLTVVTWDETNSTLWIIQTFSRNERTRMLFDYTMWDGIVFGACIITESLWYIHISRSKCLTHILTIQVCIFSYSPDFFKISSFLWIRFLNWKDRI